MKWYCFHALAIAFALLLGACSPTDGPTTVAAQQPAEAKPAGEGSSRALFEQRILPLFQATRPSSCSECHLSGVDLKDYIRPTEGETFHALVAADLIDLKHPDDSKILRFIRREPEQPNLITQEIRQQEAEAFQSWITAAVNDPVMFDKADAQPIGPTISADVIRHARRDRVLNSFVENIWTEVGRCAACHSPDQNQKQVKEHGQSVSWIKLGDPQGTLDYMVKAGLIDTDDPEKSQLLTKPTMQEDHGGGQKMVIGDRSYKQFRTFLDDYAAMSQNKYAKTEQLPEVGDEISEVTEIWLKIESVPAKYDQMLLQVDLYREADNGWTEYRVATSDRPVYGKGNLWQHSLSLTAPRESSWSKSIAKHQLPAGRYLAKIYVDQTGKLEQDFTAILGAEDLVGEVELESRWPAGHGKMTKIKFPGE